MKYLLWRMTEISEIATSTTMSFVSKKSNDFETNDDTILPSPSSLIVCSEQQSHFGK